MGYRREMATDRPLDRGPEAVVNPPDRLALTIGSLILGASLVIALYVTSFPPERVRNLGSDASGYIVQMRAASLGILDLEGTRPGVGVVGASIEGTGLVPIEALPIVLSITLVICMGLAATAALRLGYELPAWSLGVGVVLVATWGGTARLVSGYLANLESLTLFLLAMVLATASRRHRRSFVLIAVLFASIVAHPGLFPAYAAILLGWLIVSLLLSGSRLRERTSPPAITLIAFVVASVFALVVLAGWIGLRLPDLQDFSLIGERFDQRVKANLAWIGVAPTILMIVAGTIVISRRRRFRRSWSMNALGAVWLLVSVAGLVLVAFIPSLPGHRTVLLGLPAPMLGAIAVGGVAEEILRRVRVVDAAGIAVRVAVVGFAAAITLGSAVVTLRPLEAQATSDRPGADRGPAAVAAYLLAIDERKPVVMVMDPRRATGIRFWRSRQNAVRSLAPDDVFLDVVTYLGDERLLLRGMPTRRTGAGARLFNLASDRTWPAVRERLDDDPIVLMARPWVAGSTWKRVAPSATTVTPGLAVVRGPLPAGPVRPITVTELSRGAAAWRICLLVLALGIAGGGWSSFELRDRSSVGAVIGLAPAFGITVTVLVGLMVALLGGDPGGAVGLGSLAIVSVAGWGAAWHAHRVADVDGEGSRTRANDSRTRGPSSST